LFSIYFFAIKWNSQIIIFGWCRYFIMAIHENGYKTGMDALWKLKFYEQKAQKTICAFCKKNNPL